MIAILLRPCPLKNNTVIIPTFLLREGFIMETFLKTKNKNKNKSKTHPKKKQGKKTIALIRKNKHALIKITILLPVHISI